MCWVGGVGGKVVRSLFLQFLAESQFAKQSLLYSSPLSHFTGAYNIGQIQSGLGADFPFTVTNKASVEINCLMMFALASVNAGTDEI